MARSGAPRRPLRPAGAARAGRPRLPQRPAPAERQGLPADGERRREAHPLPAPVTHAARRRCARRRGRRDAGLGRGQGGARSGAGPWYRQHPVGLRGDLTRHLPGRGRALPEAGQLGRKRLLLDLPQSGNTGLRCIASCPERGTARLAGGSPGAWASHQSSTERRPGKRTSASRRCVAALVRCCSTAQASSCWGNALTRYQPTPPPVVRRRPLPWGVTARSQRTLPCRRASPMRVAGKMDIAAVPSRNSWSAPVCWPAARALKRRRGPAPRGGGRAGPASAAGPPPLARRPPCSAGSPCRTARRRWPR